LDQPANAAPLSMIAITVRTSVTLATVDRPVVLEVTQLTVGLDKIAQARTAGIDRPQEDVAYGPGQTLRTAALHGVGLPARRQSGKKQRLASVDVSQSRNDFLIQQRSLYGRTPALE
jgi:hypothetical protein